LKLHTALRNGDLGYGKHCSLHDQLIGHIQGRDMSPLYQALDLTAFVTTDRKNAHEDIPLEVNF
jgi:hypothetical protein